MVNDILLDSQTHDLVIQNGQLLLINDQSKSVAQRLKIVLQTFQGEWFANIQTGVPYYQGIFGLRGTKTFADVAIRSAILGVDGVVSIQTFSSNIDNRTRIYTYSFTALTTSGEIISITNQINTQ